MTTSAAFYQRYVVMGNWSDLIVFTSDHGISAANTVA